MNADRSKKTLGWTMALGAALLLGCGEAPPTTASTPVPSGTEAMTTSPTGPARVLLEQPSEDAPQVDRCGALTESNDRCGPIAELFPDVPGDVCDPGLPGWEPSQNAMDHLSWRTLVALLWPAKPGAPGVPDPAARPGARIDDKISRPAVFETWSSPDDLLALAAQLDEGEVLGPADWGAAAPSPGACPGGSGLRILHHVGKVAPATADALRGTPAAAAAGGPVVDQNGRLLFVETRFNRTMWDVITAGGYYRADTSRDGLVFPNNLGDTGYRQGAIAVQAAWALLTDAAAASGQYHVSEVLLHQRGTEERMGSCDKQLVGLVGLAIAHKATSGGEHWVWSAFDHKDAAPDSEAPLPQEYFLSSNGCLGADTSMCAKAPTPAGEAWACCPNHDLYGPLGPADHVLADRTPTQIALVDPGTDRSSCGERYAQALAGTPVAHFRLEGTQWWANREADTLEYGVVPRSLRVAALQPWAVAPQTGGGQRTTSSCIGCHAAGADSVFLLSSLASAPAGTAGPSEAPSDPE